MGIFFSDENLKNAIATYLKVLNERQTQEFFEKTRDSYMSFILRNMITNSDLWDFRTPFNRAHISESLSKNLYNAHMKSEAINDTFSMLLRFFIEEYLNNPIESSGEYQSVRDFCREHLGSFTDRAASQVHYALYDMSTSIVRYLLNSDDISTIRKFNSVVEETKLLQVEWETSLKERESRVQELNETLKNQDTAFNFARLNKGFENLGVVKKNQLKWARFFMIGIGLIIPILIIYASSSFIETHKENQGFYSLISIVPAISLTLIMIYYFRVSLSNFNSIRAQIMQIDLRISLCQFIQSYAEYSSEIKAKDKDLLNKFEDVIFSNIMISEEKMPSTFDGFEQIANLINSIKAK